MQWNKTLGGTFWFIESEGTKKESYYIVLDIDAR
jgi:hypothetical protein